MKIEAPLIVLNQQLNDKHSAIAMVAETLTANGKVQPTYKNSLLQREAVANTYLGKGIAIPHGVPEQRDLINETALAVIQVPEGVSWGDQGDKVRLVIGIAAKGDEHLQILRRLTRLLQDEELLQRLFVANDAQFICDVLNGEEVSSAPVANNDVAQSVGLAYQDDIVLPNPHGMHARPATALVNLVKTLNAEVVLSTDTGQVAHANKMFEILGLGLTQGAKITVHSDDENALKRVLEEVGLGLGDDLSVKAPTRKFTRQKLWEPEGSLRCIQGVGASDGLVVGKIQHVGQQDFVMPTEVQSPLIECGVLDGALAKAEVTITALMNAESEGSEAQAILEAHQVILHDVDMITETVKMIRAGNNAAQSYNSVCELRIQSLSSVADEHIAARANDIRDVRNHVMKAMLNITDSETTFSEPVIICADDLTPSDTMKLSPEHVLGFVTVVGGPTGHSAIIARNMGIPAIVAAGQELHSLADGAEVIIDGVSGCVYIEPSVEQKKSALAAQAVLRAQHEKALRYRQEKGQTQDGHFIEIAANINEAEDVADALVEGAQGVGLMRTEFIYLSRTSIPSEQEQYEKYCAMASALGDRPLIIRTLDIGGDKEVDYLGLEREDNAFLGVRGIRLCFERPDLFMPQLRAICRAAQVHNNIHMMFPMIGKVADWLKAKELVDSVRRSVGAPEFPMGVMIEVPSAALMARELAQHVDFFSVGTNDLTQYTLAMDRMHPVLAGQTDAMHPAVLRLIAMTVEAANEYGKWVGVCGGAAGESDAAKVLVGLGVKELSMSPKQIAQVKYVLRQYSKSALQDLAAQAVSQESAAAVRALLAEHKEGDGNA